MFVCVCVCECSCVCACVSVFGLLVQACFCLFKLLRLVLGACEVVAAAVPLRLQLCVCLRKRVCILYYSGYFLRCLCMLMECCGHGCVFGSVCGHGWVVCCALLA